MTLNPLYSMKLRCLLAIFIQLDNALIINDGSGDEGHINLSDLYNYSPQETPSKGVDLSSFALIETYFMFMHRRRRVMVPAHFEGPDLLLDALE